ncbi:MAG: hypothetical protein HDS31_03435 [Bacteroides sp.]|nr:hypothetical protein [Bacteroides sp.]
MPTLILKRGALGFFPSFPCIYDGFLDGKYIGTVTYNPILRDIFPESKALLKKLGCENPEIIVQ